jgi:hypothetical protein
MKFDTEIIYMYKIGIKYLTHSLCGAKYCTTGHKLGSHLVVSQNLMELEGSLPRSQALTTCTYPEPDQSSPHHPVVGLKMSCLPTVAMKSPEYRQNFT